MSLALCMSIIGHTGVSDFFRHSIQHKYDFTGFLDRTLCSVKVQILNPLTPVWPDRDDFIDVAWDQVAPEMEGNFEKRPYGDAGFHTEGSVDPMHTPYDLISAHKF